MNESKAFAALLPKYLQIVFRVLFTQKSILIPKSY